MLEFSQCGLEYTGPTGLRREGHPVAPHTSGKTSFQWCAALIMIEHLSDVMSFFTKRIPRSFERVLVLLTLSSVRPRLCTSLPLELQISSDLKVAGRRQLMVGC